MKFALLNDSGFPTAFYSHDTHGDNIPAAAVQITEAQWLEFINNPDGSRKWVNGELVVVELPTPAAPFPSTVTAAQAKIALFNAGLLDQVKAVVAAHPYEVVRLWYENAGVWERGNPYVQALGVEIGLTDEQIDDLFVAASKV